MISNKYRVFIAIEAIGLFGGIIVAVDIKTLPDEYKEIYNNFIMPVDLNISLDSVILSQENKEKIDLFIREMKHQEEFRSYGLEPMNRILMYGASGTGKTFSTKALCNYLGYTMIYIDIAKALSDETIAKNISDIFKLANYIGNCVIMLDECDAVAWQRDTGNSDTGTIRRATNSIFQQLDQMNHSNVFVAATNMLHRLDPGFERRFNLKMEFRRPQLNLKDSFKHFVDRKNEELRNKGVVNLFEFIDDVDTTTGTIVHNRASESKKLSYYEIEVLVERAMKDAIINNHREIRTSVLYINLSKQLNMKLRFKTDSDPEEIFQSNIDKYNR